MQAQNVELSLNIHLHYTIKRLQNMSGDLVALLTFLLHVHRTKHVFERPASEGLSSGMKGKPKQLENGKKNGRENRMSETRRSFRG